MGKQIKIIFWLTASLFILLISALTYRQAFSASLNDHPGNYRRLLAEYSMHRGSIFTADGKVLAESVAKDGVFKRRYPLGETYAAITGYWNPDRGRSQIEQSYNFWLLNENKYVDFEDWFSSLVNRRHRGNDLTLTIDSAIQQTAWQALGNRKGAIVVMEPKTGAILAMVSKPSFDPNRIDTDWSKISTDSGSPLINRAVQGLYPPGSTFKIITAGSALANTKIRANTIFNGPAVLRVDGSTVKNFAGEEGGRMTLSNAFAYSTNTIFAQVGLKLGAELLVKTAEKFGFNQSLKFALPTKTSSLPKPSEMDKVLLAWTAVGQGKTLVTPLQMAIVASTIANGGEVPRPYIVKTVRDYKGKIVSQTKPSVLNRALDKKTANTIKDMMVKVVRQGTGKRIWSPNYDIAGKTGTAETGRGRPSHAWFVAFAPANKPKVAISVIVEDGGLGGKTAAPIAKEIFSSLSGLRF